ncbi:FKBP-type peptidyl-prolyl cis-trans isomerase [Maribacter algicola]|uniref:FKBP-type peptidyl-prolyl cis-trans isomerase n=1 Tax=Meishania litoralis TaxID=3434685 RepID=A0ACC7LFW1_9FLAO
MTRIFLLILMVGFIWSCKNDDDNDIVVVPPRLLSEVAVENDAEIKSYLQTHFYNYEEFENPTADFDYRIKLDTIAGENSDKTPLIDQVETKTVPRSSSHFNLNDGEEDVQHTYYYLSARKGIGEQVTVADSIYVRYEGSLLNGQVFDGALFSPVWFDLARIQAPQQGARGFTEGASNFFTGGTPIINDDGTFDVEGYGVGLVIFPSGLGYFNNSQTIIPAYSPLIFKMDVFAMNTADHDGDGIPSKDEDLDKDGYLYNDNTDQDFEDTNRSQRFANFLDPDDDGDTVLTKDEIVIEADGKITFPDSDGDGTPDYLDSDS